MRERIEGEHHQAYGRKDGDAGWWNVYRGDEWITQVDTGVEASRRVKELDECANHFIQQGREEALQEIDRLAGEIGDMEVWRSTDLRTTGLQAGWIAEAEEWEINVSGTNLTEALKAAANPDPTKESE